MANKRQQLTDRDLLRAFTSVIDKLNYRSEQKGMGVMASNHEVLGILQEEMMEYLVEVHTKGGAVKKVEELKDIAVAAIWGIASIQSGGLDW